MWPGDYFLTRYFRQKWAHKVEKTGKLKWPPRLHFKSVFDFLFGHMQVSPAPRPWACSFYYNSCSTADIWKIACWHAGHAWPTRTQECLNLLELCMRCVVSRRTFTRNLSHLLQYLGVANLFVVHCWAWHNYWEVKLFTANWTRNRAYTGLPVLGSPHIMATFHNNIS